jgi:hypothetical protein
MPNSRLSTLYSILNTKHRGQSLLEALLSITLGVILIGSSVGLIGLSLKSFNSVKQHLQANSLMRQTAEIIQSLARDNWHSIYDLTKSSNYKITASGNTWTISSGQEISTINNIPYKRYFQVSNVTRDGSGNIAVSGTDDPNTQKIIAYLEYGVNYISSSTLVFYLTRSYNNQVFQQTDWSGGSGQTGPISNPGNKFDTSSNINYSSTTGQITLATTTSAGELTSSILDTGVSGGAGFNSFMWLGTGTVRLQFAFSIASSGPWTYYGCTSGTPLNCLNSANWTTSSSSLANLTATTSYPFLTSGTASPQNNRYLRYKVYLINSTPPTINDIIINWSP